MRRGEPVIIVNGMVFGYGSGEETKQSWPDIGLQFDSSIRAAKGTRATIYALDALTGKELWTSGEQMKGNHFSGITVVNGKIYLGTYEGTLYCFGVGSAAATGSCELPVTSFQLPVSRKKLTAALTTGNWQLTATATHIRQQAA